MEQQGKHPCVRPEPTRRIITLRETQLHYHDWGQPTHPAVLLVHGGCAHLHWWDDIAPALSAHHHVIAVDLRGHGDSPHVRPPAYSIDDHARDLGDLICALDLREIAVIGHSLGGIIATQLAVTAPQRIGRLALLDSLARLSPASVRYLARLRSLPAARFRTQDEAQQKFRLLPTPTTASVGRLHEIATHSVRRDEDGLWRLKFDRETLAHLQAIDLLPALHTLGKPLWMLRGELSTVVTHDRFVEMQHQLPGAIVREIAGAHHHLMLDQPSAVQRCLLDFLAS